VRAKRKPLNARVYNEIQGGQGPRTLALTLAVALTEQAGAVRYR
jgi:hypothetical protein